MPQDGTTLARGLQPPIWILGICYKHGCIYYFQDMGLLLIFQWRTAFPIFLLLFVMLLKIGWKFKTFHIHWTFLLPLLQLSSLLAAKSLWKMKHDQGTPFSPSPLLFQTLPRSSKGFQTIRGQFNEDNFQIICNMKDYYKVKLSSMDNNNRSRIIWVKMFLAIADGHYCLKAQKMHNCCRLLPQLYYIELQRSLAAVEKMWSVMKVDAAVWTFV